MNKNWISRLAGDIEAKYGKEARDRIFGDIDNIKSGKKSLSAWFENFTSGMDNLNDTEFLQQMMTDRCPCGGDYEKDGKTMKELYDQSETLEEFVDSLVKWFHKKWKGREDKMELHGNVLYMIKIPGGGKVAGSCGKGCHCSLAKFTEKTVSPIFCYCCTIGHTGRPFQVAFGNDIKMKFIESIICGGGACTMAVHLPEKAI